MKSRDPSVLLEQMLEAALRARSFVEGMEKNDFLKDFRTQQAVAMSLLTIGEMVTRLASDHPGFLARYPDTPWFLMRAMRNRIAHGYFELDFDVVWDTVLTDVPELVYRLPSIRASVVCESGDPDSPRRTDDI